jgi:hypothetical protein
MAGQKDSNPNVGGKPASGMKNEDSRVNGSKYNSQDKAPFKAKLVLDPNADVPSIGSSDGLETGAY